MPCHLQVTIMPDDSVETALPVSLGPGSSLGVFHDVGPSAREVMLTPRTRPLPANACEQRHWQGTAVATTQVDLALVTQEQWQQVMKDDPWWDARQVRWPEYSQTACCGVQKCSMPGGRIGVNACPPCLGLECIDHTLGI